MNWKAVFGLIPIIVLALASIITFVLTRPGRMQFGLRTLLIVVALVAVLLSVATSWHYFGTARTEWLAPTSPAAGQIRPTPVIVQDGDDFKATYTSNNRNVSELLEKAREVRDPFRGTCSIAVRPPEHQIDLTASDRQQLEAMLAALKKADVLKPGASVIHGVVRDYRGQPVSGAIVDLMGSYVYINYFKTRDDGRFTMPIEAPPGWGYYLRIRYDGKRTQTPYFSLSAKERQRFVRITVKR